MPKWVDRCEKMHNIRKVSLRGTQAVCRGPCARRVSGSAGPKEVRRERRKQKMIKINVISGFLGAGKTTLIRKLLTGSLRNEKVVLL